MKKTIYLLFATLFTLGLLSCSDDECTHGDGPEISVDKWSPAGMWYNEDYNEEISYNKSGTYYDRYSYIERGGETEGKWYYDDSNKRLTYNYTFIGSNVQDDWIVSDISTYHFTISSINADGLHVDKIVETHQLAAGENKQLEFPSKEDGLKVYSYESRNTRIASVTQDGLVTATGEKGTTYIKMQTDMGNVWAKITIGEDRSELWCDYTALLGESYSFMENYFKALGKPAVDDEGNYFGYYLAFHDYLESVNILIDEEKDMITNIQLFVKKGVPPMEIKNYIKSRYYQFKDTEIYSSLPNLEESKAVVSYDTENNCVLLFETQTFLNPPAPVIEDLWADFTPLFGKSMSELDAAMAGYGYDFLMSDFAYSIDGSYYYNITDNRYAWLVGFVFNPDKQISEYWVYMDTNSNAQDVYDYLCQKYTAADAESTNNSLVFYNEGNTIKIVFDLYNAAVIYTNLTMKQHEKDNNILGNYYEGLGMTHDELIAKFGTPSYVDGKDIYYFITSAEYYNMVVFPIDAAETICKIAWVFLNEGVSSSNIIDYFNSKYTVFASGTAQDGSQYAWTDGATLAESTMGIIYSVADGYVNYQLLNYSSTAAVRSNWHACDDIGPLSRKLKEEQLKHSSIIELLHSNQWKTVQIRKESHNK